jgi:hypothetical protein
MKALALLLVAVLSLAGACGADPVERTAAGYVDAGQDPNPCAATVADNLETCTIGPAAPECALITWSGCRVAPKEGCAELTVDGGWCCPCE